MKEQFRQAKILGGYKRLKNVKFEFAAKGRYFYPSPGEQPEALITWEGAQPARGITDVFGIPGVHPLPIARCTASMN